MSRPKILISRSRWLGRVCKLEPGRGHAGLSLARRAACLAEEPESGLQDWTKAGSLRQGRSLQTRPSRTRSTPGGSFLPTGGAGQTHEGLRSYVWGTFGEVTGAETLQNPAKG